MKSGQPSHNPTSTNAPSTRLLATPPLPPPSVLRELALAALPKDAIVGKALVLQDRVQEARASALVGVQLVLEGRPPVLARVLRRIAVRKHLRRAVGEGGQAAELIS